MKNVTTDSDGEVVCQAKVRFAPGEPSECRHVIIT